MNGELALKPNDFNEEGSENGKASSKVLSWQSLLKSHLSSFNVLLHYSHLLQLFFMEQVTIKPCRDGGRD